MVWENILLMKSSNDVDKIEETKIGQTYSLFLIVHRQEQLGHLTCHELCGCDQKRYSYC